MFIIYEIKECCVSKKIKIIVENNNADLYISPALEEI